jgi:hypothetical protein
MQKLDALTSAKRLRRLAVQPNSMVIGLVCFGRDFNTCNLTECNIVDIAVGDWYGASPFRAHPYNLMGESLPIPGAENSKPVAFKNIKTIAHFKHFSKEAQFLKAIQLLRNGKLSKIWKSRKLYTGKRQTSELFTEDAIISLFLTESSLARAEPSRPSTIRRLCREVVQKF